MKRFLFELACLVRATLGLAIALGLGNDSLVWGQTRDGADLWSVPEIRSTWDDLLEGVTTQEQWRSRRAELKQRYLRLLRNDQKPEKPPLAIQVHESIDVDGVYSRKLISYQVEQGERAHAYLGIPARPTFEFTQFPAVVTLHGTHEQGARLAAGLLANESSKGDLDHLCRRGYVAIAPEHFVSGHAVPHASRDLMYAWMDTHLAGKK